MESTQFCCKYPDVNEYDELRVCLSCGEVLDAPNGQGETDQSENSSKEGRSLRTTTTTSTTPYIYSPVGDGEFRLVEIQPGAFNDPLVCQIFHGRTDEATYEAISYTWADEVGNKDADQEVVVCLTQTFGARTVKATKNCVMALRRVRNSQVQRVVWIDALCINQTDVAERGHQVRQMQAIYANASMVYAYIGETANLSDRLIETVKQLKPGQIIEPESLGSSASDHRCLHAFLRRRWFSRIWCLQEVGMAKDVQVICGTDTLPWFLLVLADLEKYQRKPYLADGAERTRLGFEGEIPMILHLPMNGKQPLNKFYSLLDAARLSCAASDPRDLVFALHGLMDGAAEAGLEADYQLSMEKVFNMTTKFFIETYDCLDFIGEAERGTHFRTNISYCDIGDSVRKSVSGASNTGLLSSWAIDWGDSIRKSASQIDFSALPAHRLFHKEPKAEYTFSNVLVGPKHSMALVTNGWIHNEVIGVYDARITSAPRFKPNRTRVNSSSHQRLTRLLDHLESRGISDPHWTKGNVSYWGTGNDFHWDRLLSAIALDLNWESIRGHRAYGYRAYTNRATRAIVLLDDMSIALGPAHLARGDVLCKLKNTTVRHFLRKMDHRYFLVGEGCKVSRALGLPDLSKPLPRSLRHKLTPIKTIHPGVTRGRSITRDTAGSSLYPDPVDDSFWRTIGFPTFHFDRPMTAELRDYLRLRLSPDLRTWHCEIRLDRACDRPKWEQDKDWIGILDIGDRTSRYNATSRQECQEFEIW